MLGVLSLNLILTLVLRNHLLSEERVWVPLLLSPLLLAPGTMVAWLKHSRRIEQYKLKILARRYGEFRRELLDARKIHEAMFPKPITDGAVRFWYEYEPMRAIGGDFVFASMPPEHKGRRMSVVLMDVTGHGIAAALTVNRLSGELERVFGENPDVSPGEVLRLLNRYIHLTLARHSVYATALCLKIDCDANTVEYSSGGHPPAFLRGIDGTLHELESTTFVLGVCHHDDFDPAQQSLRYGPGDVIIAYTDGAMEARNEQGRMLGVKGMRSCLASTQSNVALLARHSLSRRPMEDTCGVWARALLQAVDAYRSGPPDDDTLVVEISRPIGGGIHAAAPPASGTTVGA
jgi:serine phosphatase RsbU (regulator of sigma subunit)